MPEAMKRSFAVLAAVLVAAVPATPAGAAQGPSASPTFTFTAGAGRADVVETGDVGSAWIVRGTAGGTMPGCTASLASFWCPKQDATRITLATLDGDDVVTLTAPITHRVEAGDGDDRVDAVNGVADAIDCGPGEDRAVADASDVLTNCEADPAPVVVPEDEIVAVPAVEPEKPATPEPKAEPKPPPTRTPPPGPASVMTGPVVQVGADASAPLTVGCGADQAKACAGTVYLDPYKKGRAKGRRTGRFGSTRFTVAAGEAIDVTVPLTAAARRALGLPSPRKARAARRGRRVKAVVTVVPKGKGKAKQRAVVELRT